MQPAMLCGRPGDQLRSAYRQTYAWSQNRHPTVQTARKREALPASRAPTSFRDQLRTGAIAWQCLKYLCNVRSLVMSIDSHLNCPMRIGS